MSLKFVVQSSLPGMNRWNDEAWSFNPWVAYQYIEKCEENDCLQWRMVLRISH
jgi:hypothetical protein